MAGEKEGKGFWGTLASIATAGVQVVTAVVGVIAAPVTGGASLLATFGTMVAEQGLIQATKVAAKAVATYVAEKTSSFAAKEVVAPVTKAVETAKHATSSVRNFADTMKTFAAEKGAQYAKAFARNKAVDMVTDNGKNTEAAGVIHGTRAATNVLSATHVNTELTRRAASATEAPAYTPPRTRAMKVKRNEEVASGSKIACIGTYMKEKMTNFMEKLGIMQIGKGFFDDLKAGNYASASGTLFKAAAVGTLILIANANPETMPLYMGCQMFLSMMGTSMGGADGLAGAMMYNNMMQQQQRA